MDYRLIELCKAGDAAAVEDFVQTYQRDVYCLALSILDDSGEAEDATQESFFYEKLSWQPKPEARLSPHPGGIPLK